MSAAWAVTVSTAAVAQATASVFASFIGFVFLRPVRAMHENPRGVFCARRAALDDGCHERGPSNRIRFTSPAAAQKNLWSRVSRNVSRGSIGAAPSAQLRAARRNEILLRQ